MARHIWNELSLVSDFFHLWFLDIARANDLFFFPLVVPMSNFATARFMANVEPKTVALASFPASVSAKLTSRLRAFDFTATIHLSIFSIPMTRGLFVIRLRHILVRRITEFIRFIMDIFIPLRSSARRRNLPHSFGVYLYDY